MCDYDVVIVGGGVVGCATAYYLYQLDKNSRILVLERLDGVGKCASGKAGGA
jgi:sarcosine oxidase subunit beta